MDRSSFPLDHDLHSDHPSPIPASNPRHLPAVDSARNIYGNTYASGNAHVHLGDTFYHNQVSRLKYVEGAEFDSYEQVHTACHPDTRKDLLQSVQAWAQQPDSKSIFWLNGMTGTGKSTIAYTVAKCLSQQENPNNACLGASFFFKRGEGLRASAVNFFPTIASQLGRAIPGFNALVEQELERDPFVCGKALGQQFDKLIRKPLQGLDMSEWPRNYIIVVDALDECDNFADIEALLQLWSSLFVSSRIPLRLFVTSRPELPVRISFAEMSSHAYRDLILHKLSAPVIEQDIQTFLRDEFIAIRKQYNRCLPRSAPLRYDWPGEEVLNKLTMIAVPLFIVATTLCRYIYDKKNPSHFDPLQRLNTVLESSRSHISPKIGQVYHVVLQQVLPSSEHLSKEEYLYQAAQICKRFRLVVGAIVELVEPLSMDALSVLLGVHSHTVELCLSPLHSVLSIPFKTDQAIRLLHLSFGEYVRSEALEDMRFYVDSTATNQILVRCCLELLSRPGILHEDMCNLRRPAQSRQAVAADVIQQCISTSVQYACRYWVYHCQRSHADICDDGEVHEFLKKHLLHWLEVMSLLNNLAEVIEYVRSLQLLISPYCALQVKALLADAERFLLVNRYIIDIAPLQVYSSAIIFLPTASIVRQKYESQIPHWIKQRPIMPAKWSEELQTLEGHRHSVNAAIFSPSGSLLASASHSGHIRLWTTRTGQEMHKLEGHTGWVAALAFHPNGLQLASASNDKTIRVWNVYTGQTVQILEGHVNSVTTVAFSPSGLRLVSASMDKTIRVWDLDRSTSIQILRGHEALVHMVTFSPDGSLLASASLDAIRLWSTTSWDTGMIQDVRVIKGCHGSVAVAFSPDGLQVASASGEFIQLWNTTTGLEIRKFGGNRGRVKTVAFSPEGSLLASASGQLIKIWDTRSGKEVRTYRKHSAMVTTVNFSHNGLLLASASLDKTIRLWRIPPYGAEADREARMGITPSDAVSKIIFSHGGSLLASASVGTQTQPDLWNTATGELVKDIHTVERCSPHSVAYAKEMLWRVSRKVNWNLASNQFIPNNMWVGDLRRKDDWIEFRGDRLLWLPPAYRREDCCASWEDLFAIGCENAAVIFIRIGEPYIQSKDQI